MVQLLWSGAATPETAPESWFIGKNRALVSQWFADMPYEVSRSTGTNFLGRSFRFVKAILHLRIEKGCW
jgi:hypothetical protein